MIQVIHLGKKTIDIPGHEPSVASRCNAEGFYDAFARPSPQRIGMNMEKQRHFFYGQHFIRLIVDYHLVIYPALPKLSLP